MKIVVVEDDRSLADMLKHLLGTRRGWDVSVFYTGKAFLEAQKEAELADLFILDVKLPDISGLELLSEIRDNMGLKAPVIVASAYGDREVAIEAIRRGADDYIQKPFDIEELEFIIDKILEKERVILERNYLRRKLAETGPELKPVSVSPGMASLVETAQRIAPFKTPVLITGESGVGKEVMARFIHSVSDRAEGPFVAVNCGAIPSELVESELFGHEKGAFTGAYVRKKGIFEVADGGTIFLDEIAELALPLQVKLLRVLQDGSFMRVGGTTPIHVNVRVISATAKDLEREVKQGLFREDLFFRLNVIHLRIPPLRERKEDIPVLVKHFLEKYSAIHGKGVKNISNKAMERLINHPWPGNVRELENLIERAVILCEGDVLTEKDLLLLGPHYLGASASPGIVHVNTGSGNRFLITEEDIGFLEKIKEAGLSLKNAQKRLEQYFILKALEKTRGNVLRASKLLGISHRAIVYKIQEYNLSDKVEELRKRRKYPRG